MANDDYFRTMYKNEGVLYYDCEEKVLSFNSEKISKNLNLLARTTHEMMWGLVKTGCELSRITKVVGVGIRSAVLADKIAHEISEDTGENVQGVYTEEKEVEGTFTMVLDATQVQSGDCVVLCADALLTGTRMTHTAQAIEERGAILLPYITVILNNSGCVKISETEIVSILNEKPPCHR